MADPSKTADPPDFLTPDQVKQLQQPRKPPKPGSMPDFLPPEFPSMSPDQQQQYLTNPPDTLPEEFPQMMMHAAIPIAATAAAPFAPEFAVGGPLLSGALNLLTRGTFAAGGGGLASLGESAMQESAGDPERPGSVSEAFKRAGRAGLEQGEYELGGGLATGLVKGTAGRYFDAERLYQSALKPTGISEKEVLPVVQTGIRENIPLTRAGQQKLAGLLDDADRQIKTTISQSPQMIPATDYVRNVQQRLDNLRTEWGPAGSNFVKDIDKFERGFLINNGNLKPRYVLRNGQYVQVPWSKMSLAELRSRARPMSTIRAQDVKQAFYKVIRANRLGAAPGWHPYISPGVELETREEIARAMREELGNRYQGLHAMNDRYGNLIELNKAVDTYLKREANRQISPYFIFPIAGGLAGGLTHGGHGLELGGAAGALLGHGVRSVLENPAIKSNIAMRLERAARLPGAGLVKRGLEEVPAAAIRYYQRYGDQDEYAPLIEADPERLKKAGLRPPSSQTTFGLPQPPLEPSAPTPPAPPAPKPEPRSKVGYLPDEYKRLTAATAKNQSVSLPLINAVIANEAAFDPKTRRFDPAGKSSKGAVGLMQVEPGTAHGFGYSEDDLRDPAKNIDAGTRYLKQQLAAFPTVEQALAAYNWGPERVRQAMKQRKPLPDGVRKYVNAVMRDAAMGIDPEAGAYAYAQ